MLSKAVRWLGLSLMVGLMPSLGVAKTQGQWHPLLGLGLLQNKPLHGAGDTSIYDGETIYIYTGARYQQGTNEAALGYALRARILQRTHRRADQRLAHRCFYALRRLVVPAKDDQKITMLSRRRY